MVTLAAPAATVVTGALANVTTGCVLAELVGLPALAVVGTTVPVAPPGLVAAGTTVPVVCTTGVVLLPAPAMAGPTGAVVVVVVVVGVVVS